MPLYHETDMAWLAGFFDGEGVIGIYANNRTSSPHVKIGIAQNIKAMLENIQSEFGGYLGVMAGGRKKERSTYALQFTSRETCIRFLRAIHPYLIRKREEAELALMFLNLPWRGQRGPYGRTDSQKEIDLKFVRAIKELK